MAQFTLTEIAAITGGQLHGDGSTTVGSYQFDSRLIRAQDALFIAVAGEHRDGHAFVDAAATSGARACLIVAGRAHPSIPHVAVTDIFAALHQLAHAARERTAPKTVAITGSVGKTTVKDFAAAACQPTFRVHAAKGSQNNELGVPLTVISMPDDTQVLVSEIGARHGGDIAHLAPLVQPDISVVTAVAPVHLEIFGSIEAIAKAKAELVHALKPTGTAVLNVDDPRVLAMADCAPNVLAVSPSSTRGDVYATDVTLDARAHARATVVTPWGVTPVAVPLPGKHHLANAMYALGVAGLLGVDIHSAATQLATAHTSPWRSELHEFNGVWLLNDAYNANPLSMRAAMDSLHALNVTGRRIAVLGEMAEIGPTAANEHAALGRYLAQSGVALLLTVGDAATRIADGARDAGMADVMQCDTPHDAAATLATLVVPGDAVLVKASRSAGLERVAADLAAHLTDTERNTQ